MRTPWILRRQGLPTHRTFEGKPDILIAEIPLPALAPGEYDLVISVEDVGTERRAEIAKPLIVR